MTIPVSFAFAGAGTPHSAPLRAMKPFMASISVRRPLRMSCAMDGRWMSARGFAPAFGVSAAFSQLDRTAAKAEQSVARFDEALPGLMLKISGTLDGVQEVVTDARTVSSAASQSVPQLLRDAQPLVGDAREIARGVKQSWPVRNMLPPPASGSQ